MAKVKKNSVTVRVPATSANLGPGYDVLGISLDIWQEVTVERAEKFSMECFGEGADKVPINDSNLVIRGVKAAFEMAGEKLPPLKYTVLSQIPFARGMGSSSAGLVAGLIAGLTLTGHETELKGEEALLQIAAKIEGHPDNVSPAIYGGLQMGLWTGTRWYTHRIRVPAGLQCVLFIPDKEKKGGTEQNRALLKPEVSRKDAVFNLQRVAFLVSCFESDKLHDLKYAMEDALHQPQRAMVMPHTFQVIKAALDAGALGAYLSGAGPAVMALCAGRGVMIGEKSNRVEERIAKAMVDAAARIGVTGRAFITYPTQVGAHVVKVDPPASDGVLKRFSPFKASHL
eukprot:TRINITY_DN32988_c0_g1_i1.p1 TRINITY_DN32988_c0_g1~~TRINITY_DN32988_c0_g1_i1.p1  ORF type:complete len:342 (+),score=151.57 TRINITY_DN32988_c0_g1_i1:78-1103(+)